MSATKVATPLLTAAREAYGVGLCTVPPREDGSKAPIAAWAEYQRSRPDAKTLRRWFTEDRQGLGIVTGAVSGHVRMFEFDDRATFERFLAVAEASGYGHLVARIRAGYEEATPGDGIHWLVRCPVVCGNTTLASRPQPDGKKKALIQTREDGGFSVLAPSHGKVHPSGRPYRLCSGSFATIADLTPEEWQGLRDLARTFDEVIRPEAGDPTPRPTSPAQGDRPGDLFNAVASWDDILTPHGWTFLFRRGGVGYWRRPGKDHGISATTNWGGFDYFYVFTTSTEFDDERGYTRFSVYATLEHGGDFKAAARALRAQGFGGREYRPVTATLDGERVDIATPEAEVDDTARAIAELRARVIDMERRFRQREEEWSALGQHLANENVSPADRIITYKLASEALSRPIESGDEEGYRLIRIGETDRAVRHRVEREREKLRAQGMEPPEIAGPIEGWGLARAAGLDAKTVSKAVRKYGPRDAKENPEGWGLIGRRERFGRDDEGRPRSDILVRLPADRVIDVLVDWRDFAPDQPRNHGGKREPCPRCGSTKTRTVTYCGECDLVLKETHHAGEEGRIDEDVIAAVRAESQPDEPRADVPSVPPTPVTVVTPRTYPPGPITYEEGPDDADPLPLEDACWHQVGTPWACTTSVRPSRRNPNGPQYCDFHQPDAVAKRQGPTFAVEEPEAAYPPFDAPAPHLPPYAPPVDSPASEPVPPRPTVSEPEPFSWDTVPHAETTGPPGCGCAICGEPLRFALAGRPLLCKAHRDQYDDRANGLGGYADAAGGGK